MEEKTNICVNSVQRLHDEPICAHCSRQSGGCCIADPEAVAYCFPLSIPELKRLLPYAYLANEGGEKYRGTSMLLQDTKDIETLGKLVVEEMSIVPFIIMMEKILPGYELAVKEIFPEGKWHFRLRTEKDGACVFLGADGCRLPRQVRPWYCQMFPGWVQKEDVTLLMDASCLALEDVKNPLQGLIRFGMTPEDIRYFHHELLCDWGFIARL